MPNNENRLDINISGSKLKPLIHKMGIDVFNQICSSLTCESFNGVDFCVNWITATEISVFYSDIVVLKLKLDDDDDDDYYGYYTCIRATMLRGDKCINYDVYNITEFYINFCKNITCDFLFMERFHICHYGIKKYRITQFIENIKRELLNSIIKMETSECVLVPSIDFNNNIIKITVKDNITLSKFDTRFFGVKDHKPKGMDNTGNIELTIDLNLTEDELGSKILLAAQKIDATIQDIFNSCYEKYLEYVRTTGGCMITIDGNKILAHKDVMPTANNAFITFKCPYTNDIITKNISNVNSIAIKGMDEYHSTSQQHSLLG
jgi:hypothetical protein